MHLNYFFLKALCGELNTTLTGYQPVSCFSQQKDELILCFSNHGKERFIRASLIPQLTFISFPETFARSRKNTANLFEFVIGTTLLAVAVTPFDRSFVMQFDNGSQLLFKMHGSRSNIVGTDGAGNKHLFRNQLTDDESVSVERLAATLDLSQACFENCGGDTKLYLPALGKEVAIWLEERGYGATPLAERWTMMSGLLRSFETPSFFIGRWLGKVQLLLFAAGEVLATPASAIEAANVYAQITGKEFYLNTALLPLVSRLKKDLRHTKSYLKQAKDKLLQLQTGMGYTQLADVLMANLHQVPVQEEVTLDNFYTGEKISIKLKKNLSLQKNAELFYKKAKNQKIEIQKLEESIIAKTTQEEVIDCHIHQLEEMDDIKSIKKYIKEHALIAEKGQNKVHRPFKVYEVSGYEVWVGTNAKNNDKLTLKYATKNDLWFHAKDVPGSHVVLKWKPGQNYPKPVIEQVASIAAYFSKRKTDTLCPVLFTPKKYVRKPGGGIPGAVVVEREEVILVAPGLPD